MCLRYRTLDPKSKRLFMLGNLCLVIAIVAQYLYHPAGQVEKNVLDGVRGLLYGISIGINFFVIRRGQCHSAETYR
jgi:hypothetical protein